MAVTRLGSVTGTDSGKPPGQWTTQSASTPALSFTDALTQYFGKNPYSKAAYEGLFPYLTQLGFKVERPTHAGGTLPSDDKVVDSSTGKVYDLVFGVDGPNPTWGVNDTGEFWWDGKPQGRNAPPPGYAAPSTTTAGGTQNVPGSHGKGSRPGADDPNNGPAGGNRGQDGVPPDVLPAGGNVKPGSSSSTTGSTPGADAAAAYAAARRQRSKASAGGRRSTILGGFHTPAPTTRMATLLGSLR